MSRAAATPTKHRRQVQAEPYKKLPEVPGERDQLQQVLLNLITNVIEAMAARMSHGSYA